MNLLTEKQGSEYIAKSTIVVDRKPVSINFESKGVKSVDGKQVLTLVGAADGLELLELIPLMILNTIQEQMSRILLQAQ